MGHKTFFLIAVIAAAIALYLSFQIERGGSSSGFGVAGGSGVDIGADGGAAGFGIISAACFASSAWLKQKQMERTQ